MDVHGERAWNILSESLIICGLSKGRQGEEGGIILAEKPVEETGAWDAAPEGGSTETERHKPEKEAAGQDAEGRNTDGRGEEGRRKAPAGSAFEGIYDRMPDISVKALDRFILACVIALVAVVLIGILRANHVF